MKLKSPFNLFSLSAPTADLRGNYANPQIGKYKPTTFKHPKLSDIKNEKAKPTPEDIGYDGTKPSIKPKGLSVQPSKITPQVFNTSIKTQKRTIIPQKNYFNEIPRAQQWAIDNPVAYEELLKKKREGETQTRTISTIGDTTLESDWTSSSQMKGSPNKLIGDTMDPYGQINPGAVPPNQAQNDLGAQPIIGAQGSQPNARAIDMAAIGNPYATPGADFSPQSRMKAESMYGSSGQRQGLMNLGTPLHHDSEKQAHTHPSRTTTKMKPDGEYPGARYVKGDLVDQDDLLDKTELDAHIATQVQSDKKGTFIKEMPDTGPGSDIETSKGFGKKIRLESMGRSSYTSNMKDQMDPHNFLFKKTPKK